jgi:hypothetical protein
MKKYRLLLLDANIVIRLFELELWERFIDHCEVIIARTVAEHEALYFIKENQYKQINLDDYENNKLIRIVDVPIATIKNFKNKFDPTWFDRIDPGEAESLAFLEESSEEHHICSGDAIVYRVLACLDREEQGISLEEVLDSIGLSKRKLGHQYTKAFRKKCSDDGSLAQIQGRGLKPHKK